MPIYVSGPMTGIKDHNYVLFNRVTRLLRIKGHKVVNPAELDVINKKETWVECLKRDITELMSCDSIALLPGWWWSKGAKLEVFIGWMLGYKIHYYEYYI